VTVKIIGLNKLFGNGGYSGPTYYKIQLFETGFLVALVLFLFQRKSR